MSPRQLKTNETIELLRQAVEEGPKSQAIEHLKKALAENSNFLVGKAAEFTSHQLAYELIPDLRAAFERFVENGPGSWSSLSMQKSPFDTNFSEAMRSLRSSPSAFPRWRRQHAKSRYRSLNASYEAMIPQPGRAPRSRSAKAGWTKLPTC